MAELLTAELLDVPHGFSTRAGALAGDCMAGAPLVTAEQVHSARVVRVDAPWPGSARPQADAMVSARPGIVLGIVTADCAPVLLADREAGVIGAAHAGRRGAAAGILENTVAEMEALGARRNGIAAAIGPCIAQASYEVDAPFRAAFDGDAERFFASGEDGHFLFDLPGFVADRLRRAGVGRTQDLAQDTYADETRFFSYRRAMHRAEPTGGRQISLIALRETA